MTTEHDHEIMEELLRAARAGEVERPEDWALLCKRLGATDSHRFAVTMMLGGRWPWQSGEEPG